LAAWSTTAGANSLSDVEYTGACPFTDPAELSIGARYGTNPVKLFQNRTCPLTLGAVTANPLILLTVAATLPGPTVVAMSPVTDVIALPPLASRVSLAVTVSVELVLLELGSFSCIPAALVLAAPIETAPDDTLKGEGNEAVPVALVVA
jgi:hypothetical protein